MALWPDNLPAAQLFLGLQTQWRRAGMDGVPVGLDYRAVEAALRLTGITVADRPALFADLQAMEAEQLAIIHRRRQAEAAKAKPSAPTGLIHRAAGYRRR